MNRVIRRSLFSGASIMILAATIIVSGATPALADTSNATALALDVTGPVAVNTGPPCTASSGATSGACTVGTSTGNLSSLVAAALLTQSATSTASGGNSAACAGLTGPGGGSITIGPSGQCVAPVNPAAGGVVLLGGLVTANAVYATCSDTGGTPTGSSTTVALNPTNTSGGILSLGGLLGTLGTVAVNPAVSTPTHLVVTLTPLLGSPVDLLTLDLNTQTTTGTPPQLTVTALDLKILTGLTNLPAVGTILAGLGLAPGSVAEVIIGRVTCGPNSVTATPPAFPVRGLPLVAATLGVAGGAAVLVRRRRIAASRVA